MKPGRFIVIEGIDGAGKSTHLEFICTAIREACGAEVLLTREPGGTPLAERIRDLLLHQDMDGPTEVLLAFAARHDHLERVIRPALGRGHWVVCDRFTDSTRAYQGGGAGVDARMIEELARTVHGDLNPDRVYVFDAPATLAQERRQARTKEGDRFEGQDTAYFERVRHVYLDRARSSPDVYRRIDSSQAIEAIRIELRKDIASLC